MKLSSQDILGVKLIAGGAAFLILMATLAIVLSGGTEVDEFNCVAGQSYRNTVLLVDNTDAFSENQRGVMRRLQTELTNNLTEEDRLTVYVLNETDAFSPTAALSICRPRSGADASRLVSNPRRIQEAFEEVYAKPLAESLLTSQEDSGANRSPIAEFIEGIVNSLSSMSIFDIHEFIIVSDLFQNMPELNQYALPEESLDQIPPYYQSMFENIGRTGMFSPSTNVRVIYLIRQPIAERQTLRHMVFWENAFETFGINMVLRETTFTVEPVR
jgi:hypothetical protein